MGADGGYHLSPAYKRVKVKAKTNQEKDWPKDWGVDFAQMDSKWEQWPEGGAIVQEFKGVTFGVWVEMMFSQWNHLLDPRT